MVHIKRKVRHKRQQMKYRYREKTYCYGSYALPPMEPGDQWIREGLVRFQLPALLIDIEEKPEQFTLGQLPVADYVRQAEEYRERYERIGIYDEDQDVTEPLVAVEYGPGEWRILDGWLRVTEAASLGMDVLPAVLVPSDLAMRYLVDEEDVRHYIEYWNFRAAYWERRDRINGFLQQEDPVFTEICVDPEATWQSILQACDGRYIEIPIRWNRWFSIHGDGTKVVLGEASHMAPVCPLTFDRPVRKKEFMEIFPLYEEWEKAAHEEPIRERARRITISYEYIFSMIRQYAAEGKCDILSAKK